MSAPAMPDELKRLTHRLRLPYLRAHAPEVIATAKAQRWDPAEVLRVLLQEEARGRDAATREMRRRQAAFPSGKTFDGWRDDDSSIPLPTQCALRTLEWVGRLENLALAGPSGTGKSHLPLTLPAPPCCIQEEMVPSTSCGLAQRGDGEAMEEQAGRNWSTRRRVTALATLVGLAVLAVGVLPTAAEHGGPHVVQLARGSFTDQVGATVKLKLDGRATRVVNLKDASDFAVAEITVPDGAAFPWHTHPGPVLVANEGPGTLTFVHADDCVLREYDPGEAFVDPGQGNVHTAFNDSGQDLVMYAAFLGVVNGLSSGAPAPEDCDPFP